MLWTRIRILTLIALMVCPIVLGVTYIREFIAIDAALDAGASWDYVAMKPDFAQNHRYLPFSTRHSALLIAGAVSGLLALIYAIAIRAEKRSRI